MKRDIKQHAVHYRMMVRIGGVLKKKQRMKNRFFQY